MKTNLAQLTTLALLPASMLTFTSCSSTPEGQGSAMVATEALTITVEKP